MCSLTSADFCVDLDWDGDCDITDVNTADWPLKHSVLKMNFSELEETCRHVDVTLLSPMEECDEFALGIFLDPIADNVFSNDPLRCDAEFLEAQME